MHRLNHRELANPPSERRGDVPRHHCFIAVGSTQRENLNLQSVTEFPEAVLADDPSIGVERPEVAATHFDLLAIDGRASDRPLRHTTMLASEMDSVVVADVGHPFEARG